MKQHSTILIVTILIIATLSVVLIMRKDLCKVQIKTDLIEVAAFMACQSVKEEKPAGRNLRHALCC